MKNEWIRSQQMTRSIICLVACLGWAGIGLRGACGQDEKPKIQPRLSECSISVGDRDVVPATVSIGYRETHETSQVRVEMTPDQIRLTDPKTGEVRFSVELDDDIALAWLGELDQTGLFTPMSVRGKPKKGEGKPASIRRLDLRTGKWLEDITIARADGGQKQIAKRGMGREELVQLLKTDSEIVVVTVSNQLGRDRDESIAYRVTCYELKNWKERWSNIYPSLGTMMGPGVYLLASSGPRYLSPRIQAITRTEDAVVICAGQLENIMGLDIATGAQNWKSERVWEYVRGFVGPSVWQHDMRRWGVDDPFEDMDDDQTSRVPIETPWNGSIVGGPIVFKGPARWGGGFDDRFFVVVSRGAPAWYSGYVTDCVVYELGRSGHPIALVNIPRMIRGGDFALRPDGIVWACEEGGFVKLIPSENDRGMGMGPGGPDHVAHVAWYQQPVVPKPDLWRSDAWLSWGPWGDRIAFTDTHAFRVSGGGVVQDESDQVINFNLTRLDLNNGSHDRLNLTVPFDGRLIPPETGAGQVTHPDGSKRYTVRGPYAIAITGLERHGDHLRVVLGMEEWSASLDFSLDELSGDEP